MVKRTGPTNVQLQALITLLKKRAKEQDVPLWLRIAEDLERPTRSRREVNLQNIDRYTEDNDFIIVPGKVLGSGALNHKVTVAAYGFSESAKKKIAAAKGSVTSIAELIEKNPKGQNVRIIG
ncbi:MAG TPA: 50S ribosomal protein L18e [Candidatus Nanoarchaeia archaeon]|nr:50S ribosomal protein L18e [Candidatus Nanoarchaeia archaeon]